MSETEEMISNIRLTSYLVDEWWSTSNHCLKN